MLSLETVAVLVHREDLRLSPMDAKLDALMRRLDGLRRTLAIYSDPDDYRRPAWQRQLADVEDRAERAAAALVALRQAVDHLP